jgi:hypothetical protein
MSDFTKVVKEKTTQAFTAVLQDETGAVIPAASITALTLTLYDLLTNAIINSRDHVSIKNANGGTIDASGNLTWTSDVLDSPILNDTLAQENHIALIEWTYNSGKQGRFEVALIVRNMVRVS